jgi:hypothetical protein
LHVYIVGGREWLISAIPDHRCGRIHIGPNSGVMAHRLTLENEGASARSRALKEQEFRR